MSMWVGQSIWHGGWQYALWSDNSISRLVRRMWNNSSEFVVTTMPGRAGVVHAGNGCFTPSICTRHMRQVAVGSNFSSSHIFGISVMPLSAATLSRV
jgi:hypothetical protein